MLCKPLNTAGHSIALAFPDIEQRIHIDIPVSLSDLSTPEETSISTKGMSCPETNADAHAGAALTDHFPSPIFDIHEPSALRASDLDDSVSAEFAKILSVASADASSGGNSASTCKIRDTSGFCQGIVCLSANAKSCISPSWVDFGAPPDAKVAWMDRMEDRIVSGSRTSVEETFLSASRPAATEL